MKRSFSFLAVFISCNFFTFTDILLYVMLSVIL